MSAKNNQDLTEALAKAVESNKHPEIASLLKKGADPNDKVRGMPVIISLTMGKGEATIKTLKLLLAAGLKPDVKVEFGSALGFAARWADDKLLEAYLAGGANPKAFQSWAMLEAAQAKESSKKKMAGLRRVLEILVQAGVNVDQPFWSEKLTPLMIAASQGNVAVVEKLLELGADIDRKDAKGKTALDHARKEKQAAIITLLGEHGAAAKPPGKEKQAHMTAVYTAQLKKPGPHILGIKKVTSVYETSAKLKGCFPGCGCAPVHLAKINLTKFPEFPPEIKKLGQLNVVYSWCNNCDPEDFVTFQIGAGGKLKPWGSVERGDCDPSEAEPSVKETRISFSKDSTGKVRSAIRIGGNPQWVQNRDDWVDCEKCGQKPFFIGEINRFEVPPGSEGPAYHLYVFVCAKCRLETVVKQMT